MAESVAHIPTSLPAQDWASEPYVQAVVVALEQDKGVVRFVGGCVRNALLGVPISDIDMATTHRPPKVIELLEKAGLKAVPTGLQHGTVTAVSEGRPIEVTTLRADVETYGRKAKVAFTQDWQQDAERRDFTMNAIYADPDGTLFDPVGGVEDAMAAHVRFIGNAGARIQEDYLRILRFFRFHAQYGNGEIDPTGLEACAGHVKGLDQLSGERIQAELFKLLEAPGVVNTLGVMAQQQILSAILSDIRGLEVFTRLTQIEENIARTPDAVLRLSALLPQDPTVIASLAHRLRLSNEASKRLAFLSAPWSPFDPHQDQKRQKRHLYWLSPQEGVDRVLLDWAMSGEGQSEAWATLAALALEWERPAFPVTGAHVMAAGVSKGPDVGQALDTLKQRWVESNFTLTKEDLLAGL